MTTRTAPGSRAAARVAGIAAAAAERDQVDVLGLDAEATLATIAQMRRQAEQAQVVELRAVAHWADQHRVSDPGDWLTHGSVSTDGRAMTEDLAGRPQAAARLAGVPGELGTEGILRLAGEGAFCVHEFAVTDLAVLLAMSEQAARSYVAQTVELRDRLPRLWAQVMAGRLPVWKARRIAEATVPLGAAAAGFVDAQLETLAHRLSLTRITRCVEAATIRFHPDLAANRAEAAADQRGVWLEDDTTDATTQIHAVVDSPDAHAFGRAVDATATVLGALGDGSSRQTRRARAVGVLADPQYALNLTAAATTPTVDGPAKVTKTAASPVFHLHLHTGCTCDTRGSDIATTGAEAGSLFGPVTRTAAEGLSSWRPGPVPTAAVARWLDGLTPGTRLTVTPVVDLAEQIAVDAYEHPTRLQRQVAERDHTCQFPWCGRAGATYDLDHIEPYAPPDHGGPPDQSSTANTARLCRYHHRVKTHGAWTYRRTGPTTVTWTSPQHRTYTVDHTGTQTTD